MTGDNTSSHYYNVVKDVYAIWTKNNFKTSRELIDYLKEKGHGQFTYMLEKGLPKIQSGNTTDPTLLSRSTGSSLAQSAQTADTALASISQIEEMISLTYRLIIIAVSLVFILVLIRIRAKRKKQI